MALRLEDKKTFVKEVNAVAGESVTAVAAEYRGLTVAEMTALRKEARKAGVYMRVVKNTLARRAVVGTDFECMQDTLKGPILLAFAKDDPGAAARVIKDFAKEHEALKAETRLATNFARVGSAFPRSIAFDVTLTTRLMIHRPMMRTTSANRNLGP